MSCCFVEGYSNPCWCSSCCLTTTYPCYMCFSFFGCKMIPVWLERFLLQMWWNALLERAHAWYVHVALYVHMLFCQDTCRDVCSPTCHGRRTESVLLYVLGGGAGSSKQWRRDDRARQQERLSENTWFKKPESSWGPGPYWRVSLSVLHHVTYHIC